MSSSRQQREDDDEEEVGKKVRTTDPTQIDGNCNTMVKGQPTTTAAATGGQNIPIGSCNNNNINNSGSSLNTITPCAACKLLRRRCAEECPFSPYFSPHEPHKFAAVHKVFGASNVSKMLMDVPEAQRADAANSLVYEANVRLRDPIYGCMGAISALQHQVQVLQAELHAVRAEILRFKYREAANSIMNAAAFATATATVSVAELPQAPPTPTTSPPPPSVLAPSAASADVYNSSSSYSSITNNNNNSNGSHSIGYFDG
ncbi:LOB domain-containing protein 15-like [Andrographis paniculata]|uniref:LOB domain-containing protein 15-like n=1 Tax=Andrographis paniculata TaxID=175694 RepID=UPI0021E7A002|nr:LOB domain-containing protein 15-like [Andrographis paniculata]